MKNKLYIVHLEPLDTRYTSQLRKYLPSILEKKLGTIFDIVNIDGVQSDNTVTPGAFLNFIDTNIFKSSQGVEIFKLFADKLVKDNDIFFFLDAWNPVIIQLRYILDLMQINAQIAGFFHSGSYDPQDFLGRLITNKEWSFNFERALYHAIDYNFFATKFHIRLFERELELEHLPINLRNSKVIRAGLPLDNIDKEIIQYRNLPKENIILFPHRIAPEKQPEIFIDLQKSLPEYEFIMCQSKKLSKHEYHTLLGKAKMVFSANLQETLGISPYEGAIAGAVPLLPKRLSYVEMYDDMYMYPSNWTIDMESYFKYKNLLIERIRHMMYNYNVYESKLPRLCDDLKNDFFSANNIINHFRKNK